MPTVSRVFPIALVLCAALEPSASANEGPADTSPLPYEDAALPTEARVDDLLGRMSLAEKIGQMTQAEQQTADASVVRELQLGGMLSGGDSAPTPNTIAGWSALTASYQQAARATRLHIPVLYGVDAVHGRQLVEGATVFPHLLGLAATRDADLLRRIGQATAEEMAATGVFWAFSPMVAIAEDERWGRTYESFGEDPQTVSTLATAYVRGMMFALGPGQPRPLPTAKHFIGDGAAIFGTSQTRDFLIDQGDTRGATSRLLARSLPPYRALVNEGVGSVMASFNRWNGTRMHANRALLTDLLKGQLGFKGFVVSDWEGFQILEGTEHQKIVTAVNAGIDMTMAPHSYREFIAELTLAVNLGEVTQARIDDAVRRILRVKFSMGLFEHSTALPQFAPAFGGEAHRAIAREAVAKSVTLLKNDLSLPIRRGSRVFVSGTHADNLGLQCGGWTLQWQGVTSGTRLKGTSILEGLRQVGGSATEIQYSPTAEFSARADVGVFVVGEQPYAEGLGDRPLTALVLSAQERTALARLRRHVAKLVVVLIAGRPLVITEELPNLDAVVMAWLPGIAGEGIADVLFGDRPFMGSLPIGWPRSVNELVRADTSEANRCLTLKWPLGYGLTSSGALLGPVACPLTKESPPALAHSHHLAPTRRRSGSDAREAHGTHN